MFDLYLAKYKIEPEVVENMRTWPHSGFSVDQSVYLAAGDQAGIERLVGLSNVRRALGLAVLIWRTIIMCSTRGDLLAITILVLTLPACSKESQQPLAQATSVSNSSTPLEVERLQAENQRLREELTELQRGAKAKEPERLVDAKPTDPTAVAGRLKEVWQVDYDNGYSRVYVFHGDGTLTHFDPTQTAKLSKQGARFVIEFAKEEHKDTIECVVSDGGELAIHHFNPKAVFEEGGKPSTIGKITRLR